MEMVYYGIFGKRTHISRSDVEACEVLTDESVMIHQSFGMIHYSISSKN